jgi:hypothetical protein
LSPPAWHHDTDQCCDRRKVRPVGNSFGQDVNLPEMTVGILLKSWTTPPVN